MKYGVPALFLYPEYLGNVDFWSYFIVGFALGGFVMAFNIYTYIIHAHRFPFLATLSRPFYKFSLNNFILPIGFIIAYSALSIAFQRQQEFVSTFNIILNIVGFLMGFTIFILFSFLYFFKTNKDIFKISGKSPEEFLKKDRKISPSIRQKKDWFRKKDRTTNWRVETYLKSMISINLARPSEHYDRELLKRVFFQNHINASIFEILLVVTFLVVGAFRATEIFQIPAAASALLLFTLFLMIISIFLSWVRGWTLTLLLSILLVINFFSRDGDFLNFENHVYGLNYTSEKVAYNQNTLDGIYGDKSLAEKDKEHHLQILENWKNLNHDVSQGEKPKLVFFNISGGGLRSTLWTYAILKELNERSDKLIWQRNYMVTGSSGGMLGAAYWREKELLGLDVQNDFECIAGDVLNPLLIDIASYDIFIRYQKFEYAGKKYIRDRGLSFENRFNANTGQILDKPMSDYRKDEFSAKCPMFVMSPTIINDGRRLILANHDMSFLNAENKFNGNTSQRIIENVELNRLLPEHDPDDLRFLSALRMSSTFPYILPQASLPTEPYVKIMDSGIRDNFGFKTTFQYIFTTKEWIEENTSGVIIIQIRDNLKKRDKKKSKTTLFDRITSPVDNVYGNFTQVHDYTHDQMLQYVTNSFEVPVKEYIIELDSKNKNISLSWHLTSKEKQDILSYVENPQVQEQIEVIAQEIGFDRRLSASK